METAKICIVNRRGRSVEVELGESGGVWSVVKVGGRSFRSMERYASSGQAVLGLRKMLWERGEKEGGVVFVVGEICDIGGS